jgi:hypothetical protein
VIHLFSVVHVIKTYRNNLGWVKHISLHIRYQFAKLLHDFITYIPTNQSELIKHWIIFPEAVGPKISNRLKTIFHQDLFSIRIIHPAEYTLPIYSSNPGLFGL